MILHKVAGWNVLRAAASKKMRAWVSVQVAHTLKEANLGQLRSFVRRLGGRRPPSRLFSEAVTAVLMVLQPREPLEQEQRLFTWGFCRKRLHWFPFTTMPGEDRESKQAQLALSPNPCPRPVLRPEGFALPGPLRRPADPNSPGRIANPSSDRSATGMFPSADRLEGRLEGESFTGLLRLGLRRLPLALFERLFAELDRADIHERFEIRPQVSLVALVEQIALWVLTRICLDVNDGREGARDRLAVLESDLVAVFARDRTGR